MKQIIVLATRNQGKVKELQEMLQGFAVDLRSLADFGPLPEVVEDGATFDDNAYKKALFTAKALGLPAMADDSGLVVEALGGEPGVHSARYAGEEADDAANIAKLLQEMEGKNDRRAAFVCVLSLAVPSGPALTYEGRCEGVITEAPRGSGGFGYDPVMFYPPLNKTFAEMDAAEKNRISHRGQAMAQVRDEFDKVLKWLEQRLSETKEPKPDHSAFEHNDWSREVMVK
ncbi:MAG TPA: XTP/dITP diphosphatase [Desulfurivibrio alkaliphilus]|uniref:dITP/XTP pyrophosphatase n=1 Tax=Desulfurivibrio alkaliphilus TaxID=427923 RepID=A0A7C2TH13_9BACT|nr:XTP/dITP diphosphatase [Desulfurivibrio alkaliphilus]